MNDTFSAIILRGLNNPDCSFYVGQMMGQYTTFKITVIFILIYFGLRAFENLAFQPILEWIKTKLKLKKRGQK